MSSTQSTDATIPSTPEEDAVRASLLIMNEHLSNAEAALARFDAKMEKKERYMKLVRDS